LLLLLLLLFEGQLGRLLFNWLREEILIVLLELFFVLDGEVGLFVVLGLVLLGRVVQTLKLLAAH
jgi:hypothetical protein